MNIIKLAQQKKWSNPHKNTHKKVLQENKYRQEGRAHSTESLVYTTCKKTVFYKVHNMNNLVQEVRTEQIVNSWMFG